MSQSAELGRLAVLGAGGHGRVVADCAAVCGWREIVFFDDGGRAATDPAPWPIAGGSADLLAGLAGFDGIVVGIGANAVRLAWTRRIAEAGGRLASVIHPAASISAFASIAAGSVVLAGAAINIGAVLGMATIVNTQASVDHDCRLADGVHISPGANLAGGVRIGEASWIGVGAAVRDGVAIGAGVVVGAGAVVVKPVADSLTVVGNPARILESAKTC